MPSLVRVESREAGRVQTALASPELTVRVVR
jgi:hypothetical protein